MKFVDSIFNICYNKCTIVVFTTFAFIKNIKIHPIKKKRENLWLKF